MAAPSPTQILFAPGKLYLNPTTLAGSPPYGGTAIGEVKAVACRPNVKHLAVTAEEYGGETVEMIAPGEGWVLAAILRLWDADVLPKLFGSVSGSVVSYPGSVRAGRLLSANAVKLLFVADAPLVAPSVIFYRAIALPEETAAWSMEIPTEFGVPMIFYAIRDAAGTKAVAQGLLASLTIS